jgi:hypothetical protein
MTFTTAEKALCGVVVAQKQKTTRLTLSGLLATFLKKLQPLKTQ